MSTKDINRRKNKRFRLPLNLEFFPLNGTAEYCVAKARDISREGLSFESKSNNIKLNDIIMIKFNSLKKYMSIYALGDIKWKKQEADKDLMGVRIRRVNKKSNGKNLNFPFNIWNDKRDNK